MGPVFYLHPLNRPQLDVCNHFLHHRVHPPKFTTEFLREYLNPKASPATPEAWARSQSAASCLHPTPNNTTAFLFSPPHIFSFMFAGGQASGNQYTNVVDVRAHLNPIPQTPNPKPILNPIQFNNVTDACAHARMLHTSVDVLISLQVLDARCKRSPFCN